MADVSRASLAAAALLVSLVAAPAAAQTIANVGCELHVWPSEGMSSVLQTAHDNLYTAYMGGILGSSPQQRINDNRAPVHTAQPKPDEPLDAAEQSKALSAMPLATMLGLTDYKITLHDTPLDSHTIRTVKTRYFASEAPCYADLVVSDLVYSRVYAHGRDLKTFLRFRVFGTGAAPTRSFGAWVQTKLELFSLEPPRRDEAALLELNSAFAANLETFSQLLAKRP
ncbi:MAG: hypothetical protein ABIS51_06875 [Sphingomonas sp.]